MTILNLWRMWCGGENRHKTVLAHMCCSKGYSTKLSPVFSGIHVSSMIQCRWRLWRLKIFRFHGRHSAIVAIACTYHGQTYRDLNKSFLWETFNVRIGVRILEQYCCLRILHVKPLLSLPRSRSSRKSHHDLIHSIHEGWHSLSVVRLPCKSSRHACACPCWLNQLCTFIAGLEDLISCILQVADD